MAKDPLSFTCPSRLASDPAPREVQRDLLLVLVLVLLVVPLALLVLLVLLVLVLPVVLSEGLSEGLQVALLAAHRDPEHLATTLTEGSLDRMAWMMKRRLEAEYLSVSFGGRLLITSNPDLNSF